MPFAPKPDLQPSERECGESPDEPQETHLEKLDILHARNNQEETDDAEPPQRRRPRTGKFPRHRIGMFLPPVAHRKGEDDEEETDRQKKNDLWIRIAGTAETGIEPIGKHAVRL